MHSSDGDYIKDIYCIGIFYRNAAPLWGLRLPSSIVKMHGDCHLESLSLLFGDTSGLGGIIHFVSRIIYAGYTKVMSTFMIDCIPSFTNIVMVYI